MKELSLQSKNSIRKKCVYFHATNYVMYDKNDKKSQVFICLLKNHF